MWFVIVIVVVISLSISLSLSVSVFDSLPKALRCVLDTSSCFIICVYASLHFISGR